MTGLNILVPIKVLIELVVEAKREVRLVTKDSWFMNPRPGCVSSVNFFNVIGIGPDDQIDVHKMCKEVDINPEIIQAVFSNYRQHEIQSELDKAEPDEAKVAEIHKERRQIITNLFPFAAIHWFREEGDLGRQRSLGTFQKSDTNPAIEEILLRCIPLYEVSS